MFQEPDPLCSASPKTRRKLHDLHFKGQGCQLVPAAPGEVQQAGGARNTSVFPKIWVRACFSPRQWVLLVPGQSYFVGCPAHCSTDVPLTLPWTQGNLSQGRDDNQQCWWPWARSFGLGQRGHGPPFSTLPAQKKPTAFFWGEESGLGHTGKFFLKVSFFTISWHFGPHPCGRQQMTLSSVLREVLDFVQLTSETCCASGPFPKLPTFWESGTSPDVPRLENLSSVTLGPQGALSSSQPSPVWCRGAWPRDVQGGPCRASLLLRAGLGMAGWAQTILEGSVPGCLHPGWVWGLSQVSAQFPLAGRNCSMLLALWERKSLGAYSTGLYLARSSGRALWIYSSPKYSCTQKALTPQSFCISRTSDMPRCTMDVASAEKFLSWINTLCVLLLPGAKPGCAQRDRMGYC